MPNAFVTSEAVGDESIGQPTNASCTDIEHDSAIQLPLTGYGPAINNTSTRCWTTAGFQAQPASCEPRGNVTHPNGT